MIKIVHDKKKKKMSRRNENLKIPFYYPQVWQNNIKKKKSFPVVYDASQFHNFVQRLFLKRMDITINFHLNPFTHTLTKA
jgi:hypothetical protein